jgi:ethanolamine utilization microcompartment shell protein EutL
MLDPQQAFLVNRNKIGSMALAGESLFVLEMQPASYAILAANEAEKAARIKLVDYRMIGATGRLYLSGSEADVRQAAEAAEDALLARGDDPLSRGDSIPPEPPGRPPRGGRSLT